MYSGNRISMENGTSISEDNVLRMSVEHTSDLKLKSIS